MQTIKWKNIDKKNELIIKLVRSAIEEKKPVLILEPRLQNVFYMSDILKKNFDISIDIYHGKLKKTEIRNIWLKSLKGKTKIIIATRHGIFLPLKKSGVIIFDDEEDVDFKSEDQKPYYDARTIAALRSMWLDIKLIFLSQSPRLENYIYTMKENTFSELNETRNAENIRIIDLKSGDYSPISYLLKKAVSNTLQKDKKVILFLNRKGKASFISCKDCGFIWKCDECGIPLRAYEKILWCNRCKKKEEIPLTCEKCKGVNIHFSGTGTQKVERELRKEFPFANVLRIDKDALKNPDIKKADIIIGTEYLYKNYLYPRNQINNIGLVVLPLADTLFNYPDFRTDERAFAWIVKFINLAEQESAEMIVQTYSPENQVLRLACRNSLDFYKKEIEERKKFGYPPFKKYAGNNYTP